MEDEKLQECCLVVEKIIFLGKKEKRHHLEKYETNTIIISERDWEIFGSFDTSSNHYGGLEYHYIILKAKIKLA